MRAGRREWLGLAVLALATLLLSLDMSVLHLAVPHLAADLIQDPPRSVTAFRTQPFPTPDDLGDPHQ